MSWLVDGLTIEIFKMLLTGAGVHSNGQTVRPHGGVERRVLVHVLHQQGGADGRPVMNPRAAVSVTASPAPYPTSITKSSRRLKFRADITYMIHTGQSCRIIDLESSHTTCVGCMFHMLK
jgi:hypothetical protein